MTRPAAASLRREAAHQLATLAAASVAVLELGGARNYFKCVSNRR
jgi:hypothetical protein